MDERPLPSLPLQHLASPFGEFAYCHWRPPGLAGVVEELWYSRGVMHVPRERVFPTDTLDLVLSLGDLYRVVEGGGGPASVCIGGLMTGPLVLEHARTHETIGVRLTSAGAYALLGAPMMHALTGRLVDLADVLGPDVRALAERCEAATSVPGRFHVIAAWIAGRVARAPRRDPRVSAIVAALEQSGGGAAIAGLRERAGLSKTRLAALFREQVGATPKLYARLVRFRRALALLKAGGRSFAEVAHEAGYYDQPHMNAEFREFGGVTPGEVVATSYMQGVTAAELG